MSPNQHSRGHALRRARPYSAVFTVLFSVVLTRCSEDDSAQHHTPALMSASSARRLVSRLEPDEQRRVVSRLLREVAGRGCVISDPLRADRLLVLCAPLLQGDSSPAAPANGAETANGASDRSDADGEMSPRALREPAGDARRDAGEMSPRCRDVAAMSPRCRRDAAESPTVAQERVRIGS